jgi:hypothetical protein
MHKLALFDAPYLFIQQNDRTCMSFDHILETWKQKTPKTAAKRKTPFINES